MARRRPAGAAGRFAGVHLLYVRQHGQAEGGDAYARDVWLDGGQCRRRAGAHAGRRFLPATSASHIAASSMSFAGLAAGACVAIARTFGGDEMLPLIRKTRPTLLCMLPAPLLSLVRDHGATREDFQSIRRCVSGGDKISAELEHEYTN